MSRVDLTHILAPAALQPRTSGPRDTGTDLPRGVTVHICADHDLPPTTKDATMTPTHAELGKNGRAVVDAITKHGPMDTHALRVWLGDAHRCRNGITHAHKKGAIHKVDGRWDLVNRAAPSAPPTISHFAAGVKAAEAKAQPGSAPQAARKHTATAPPRAPAVSAPRPSAENATDDSRAIATRDGGAVILEGGFLVAELTPAQTRAVQALA